MTKDSTTATSPDALISDPLSMEFYVLRDEKVALCKRRKDLPYHQNRSTYLASGRFSPEHKTVIFWPDPINPARAMKLLKDNMHIDDDYTYTISGATTRVAKSTKETGPLDKYDGVRKRQIEVLMDQGLKRQSLESDDQSEQENS